MCNNLVSHKVLEHEEKIHFDCLFVEKVFNIKFFTVAVLDNICNSNGNFLNTILYFLC